jgi:DNA ligase (NAD+)
MNIEGLSISRIETLLTYGVIKSYADLYDLENKKEIIFDIPNFGITIFEKIVESINNSRTCYLYQFLIIEL